VGAPTVTAVLNNYSFTPAGLPNSGIAQGSIFVIVGTGLSLDQPPVLQSSTGGLPKTLNQTSLSVNVNGAVTTPPIYYTSATAVAGILPSNTPTGTGTLTVTYAGQTGAAFPIQVVQSAFGIDALYGTGTGLGTIEDANFDVFSFSNPAKPKQAIILWGSGIGPDLANDDLKFPQQQHDLTNIPTTIYVGGISASIAYRGRSQFPGLDQVVVTVPDNVSPGCFVPVVVQQGNVLSNTVTLPVSADGSPCSDPVLGYTAAALQSLAGKNTVNVGAVVVGQDTASTGTVTNSAVATFQKFAAADVGSGYGNVSQGACIVVPPAPAGGLYPPTGLNPGTLTATASTGGVPLTAVGATGMYVAQLPAAAITGTGGTVTVSGAGGANVGSFSTTIALQNPLTWTNKAALTSIDQTKGATVTWTGGFPNSTVEVNGHTSALVNGNALLVNFYCQAAASAGQIVIPASVTLALPPGIGTLSVTNSTSPKTFVATGLDLGYALGSVSFDSSITYQ
jgi:uncharacterized protein (TIGR03437 family)